MANPSAGAILRGSAMAMTLLVSDGAKGYEADVHYGLTKWLAVQAGFSYQEAEVIAAGDQSSDGHAVDAVRLVAIYACLTKDKVGAQQVATYHFPTTGIVPNPPHMRRVAAGSEESKRVALSHVNAARSNSGDGREYRLQQFGVGLHAYQDSFSHQGEPGVPWLCSEDYAWGHPEERGGWRSHDADLTYKDPGSAEAMAKGTFDLMCQFKAAHTEKGCAVEWSQLSDRVKEFNQAKTKHAKYLRLSDPQAGEGAARLLDPCALNGINLNDGPGWSCRRPGVRPGRVAAWGQVRSSGPSKSAATADKPDAFVDEALSAWFVRADFEGLARFADYEHYLPPQFASVDVEQRQLAVTNAFAATLITDRQRAEEWRAAPMRMPRHLTVESAAEFGSEPEQREPGHDFDEPTIAYDQQLVFAYRNLNDALRPLPSIGDAKDQPTGRRLVFEASCPNGSVGSDAPEKCTYAITAPSATPGSLAVLVMRMIGGRWKLVGHELVPME